MKNKLTIFRKHNPKDCQEFSISSRFTFIVLIKSLRLITKIVIAARQVYVPNGTVKDLKSVNFKKSETVYGEIESVSDIELDGVYLFSIMQTYL